MIKNLKELFILRKRKRTIKTGVGLLTHLKEKPTRCYTKLTIEMLEIALKSLMRRNKRKHYYNKIQHGKLESKKRN